MRQLSVPSPLVLAQAVPWGNGASWREWLSERALWLVVDSHDMHAVAEEFHTGVSGEVWEEERRRFTRAELDAGIFQLFGNERDEVEYIMDSFSITKRKDEAMCGLYRTKELVLRAFDAMQEAADQRCEYSSPFLSVVESPNTAARSMP